MPSARHFRLAPAAMANALYRLLAVAQTQARPEPAWLAPGLWALARLRGERAARPLSRPSFAAPIALTLASTMRASPTCTASC